MIIVLCHIQSENNLETLWVGTSATNIWINCITLYNAALVRLSLTVLSTTKCGVTDHIFFFFFFGHDIFQAEKMATNVKKVQLVKNMDYVI